MIAETTHIANEAAHLAESGGALGTLGINLKLFIAQLINFSVVVVVLWKWVFTPLTQAMEKRTKEIEHGLEKSLLADKKLAEAISEKERAVKGARSEALAMIEEAEKNAERVKKDKINQTKSEIEKIAEEAKVHLAQEKDATYQALQKDLAVMITAAVSKVATGLDEKTQRTLIDKAIKELENA